MHDTILIHGYAGKDLSFWLQWLEITIGQDTNVFFPSYKQSKTPDMGDWIGLFDKFLTKKRRQLNFVAHSFGSLVTLKLIEQYDVYANNVILVACPQNRAESLQSLINKVDDSAKKTIAKFVEQKYEWDLIRSKINDLTFFFSDDDFAIPYDDTITYYKQLFPDAFFRTFHNYGHFNRKNNIFKLPEVLEIIGKQPQNTIL